MKLKRGFTHVTTFFFCVRSAHFLHQISPIRLLSGSEAHVECGLSTKLRAERDGWYSDTNIGKRLNTYFQKPQKSFASTNHTLSTTASQQSEKNIGQWKKKVTLCATLQVPEY